MSTLSELTSVSGASNWTFVSAERYVSTPLDTYTLGMSATSLVPVGTPLRYTIGGIAYYGQVVGLSVGVSIDIKGAPLTGAIEKLEIGQSHRIMTVPIYIHGTYGDDVDSSLLSSDMSTELRWRQGKAYLVSFLATHGSVDTGTEANVNVYINGSAVGSGDGLQLGSAGVWVESPSILTSSYGINWNDKLDVGCTVVGGSGDAENLTLMCTLILE